MGILSKEKVNLKKKNSLDIGFIFLGVWLSIRKKRERNMASGGFQVKLTKKNFTGTQMRYHNNTSRKLKSSLKMVSSL